MEIHWRNADGLRPETRAAAEARLGQLSQGHTDLIDVRISARPTAHHRHGGHEVRIVCQARGKELVAARERADLEASFNEALDAFEREVWRMRHRRREERSERPAAPPELGVIDQVLHGQGFGFILTDSGDRVYFHRNAVKGALNFHALEEGQRVGLNLEAGEEGLQATAVVEPPPGA
jgi:cold shock CspA family protein/ribosome-associated translation inhibitor RaiA